MGKLSKIKYVSIVPFFHDADTTIEQHTSNVTDKIGNKLDKNGKIIKGATCGASSTYNHLPMYSAHHAFNRTYNYWAPNIADKEPVLYFSKTYYTADNVYHKDNPDFADQIYFKSPSSVNNLTYMKVEASVDKHLWATLIEVENSLGIYNISECEGRYNIIYTRKEDRKKFNYFRFTFNRPDGEMVGIDELSINKYDRSMYEPFFDFENLYNVPESIYFWKEAADSLEDLPTEGVEIGSAAFVKSEGLIYLFNGKEWYPTGEGSKYWINPVRDFDSLPTEDIEENMLCFVIDENKIYSYKKGQWVPITSEIPLVTQEEKGLMSPEDKILIDKVRTSNILSTTGKILTIPAIDTTNEVSIDTEGIPSDSELVLIDEDNIRWNQGKDFEYSNGVFTFLIQAPYEIIAEIHYK